MTNVVANIFGSSPIQPLGNHLGVAYSVDTRKVIRLHLSESLFMTVARQDLPELLLSI